MRTQRGQDQKGQQGATTPPALGTGTALGGLTPRQIEHGMNVADAQAMTALHQFIRGQLTGEQLRQVGVDMQQRTAGADTLLARHQRLTGFTLAALALATDVSKLPLPRTPLI